MDERTFIREACRGDEARARRALESDSSLASARDVAGGSVIVSLVYAGRATFAAEIASRRMDLDLYEAACLGEVERVHTLLRADPDLIDHHAPDGFTALGLAAYFGHAELLGVLVTLGADLEAASANTMQVRPLHSAVAHSDPQAAVRITRALLEAGADPNAQQQAGYTPLHEAVLRQHQELARLLVAHGANPHVSNDEGDSALQLACASGLRDLVELFEEPLSA